MASHGCGSPQQRNKGMLEAVKRLSAIFGRVNGNHDQRGKGLLFSHDS